MEYRRSKAPGATYFFTGVTYQRQTIFDDAEMVDLLRDCFRLVKQRHPFVIEAMVVLWEHLHCIWTLPEGDADFSMRWRLIKSEFSRRCKDEYKRQRGDSRVQKGKPYGSDGFGNIKFGMSEILPNMWITSISTQ